MIYFIMGIYIKKYLLEEYLDWGINTTIKVLNIIFYQTLYLVSAPKRGQFAIAIAQ